MVDGVHGDMDHVVKHVVEEHEDWLGVVTILHLTVVETIVLVQVLNTYHAIPNAVLVSF